MKSWKWLIAIIIIALLAGYYVFATGLLKEHRRNGDLTSQLNNLTEELAAIPPASTDLEERLSAARADQAAAENAFSGETNDTRIVDSVLRLAEAVGVTAIPLATRPWTIELIDGNNYSVFYVTFSVTGDFPHMQSFIQGLEISEIKTLAIKRLQLAAPPAESGGGLTADIDIAVYSYVSPAN